MACLLENDPASSVYVARPRESAPQAAAKASLKRARESRGGDPKPSELPMARVKRV